jgi:hypothetical protein
MKTNRTRLQQDIEQVSGIISEMMGFTTLSEAEVIQDVIDINNGDGFVYDVRYDDNDYIGDDFTRIEGCHLSVEQLRQAILQAYQFMSITEVSPSAAAAIMGCDAAYLRQLVKEGKITPRRVDQRSYLIKLDDIKARL